MAKKKNNKIAIEYEVEQVAPEPEPTLVVTPVIATNIESHILDRRIWRGIPRRELIRILNENKE